MQKFEYLKTLKDEKKLRDFFLILSLFFSIKFIAGLTKFVFSDLKIEVYYGCFDYKSLKTQNI